MPRRSGVPKRAAELLVLLALAGAAPGQDLVLPEAPAPEASVEPVHPSWVDEAERLREDADRLEQRGGRRVELRVAVRRLAAALLEAPPVGDTRWLVLLRAQTISDRLGDLDAAVLGTSVDEPALLGIADALDTLATAPPNDAEDLDRALRDAFAPMVRALPADALPNVDPIDVNASMRVYLDAANGTGGGEPAGSLSRLAELLRFADGDAAYSPSAVRVVRALDGAASLLGASTLGDDVRGATLDTTARLVGSDPSDALDRLRSLGEVADLATLLVRVQRDDARQALATIAQEIAAGDEAGLARVRRAARLIEPALDTTLDDDPGVLRQLSTARRELVDRLASLRARALDAGGRVLTDPSASGDPAVLSLAQALVSAQDDVRTIDRFDAALREGPGGPVQSAYRRLAGRLTAIARSDTDMLLELAGQAVWIVDMPGEDELAAALSRSPDATLAGPVASLVGSGEDPGEQVEALARLLREARGAWADRWVDLDAPDPRVLAGLAAIRALLRDAGDLRRLEAIDERSLNALRWWQLEPGAAREIGRGAELTLGAQLRALLERDAGRAMRLAGTAGEQLAVGRVALAIADHADGSRHALAELALGAPDHHGHPAGERAAALAELCVRLRALRSSNGDQVSRDRVDELAAELADELADGLPGG